MRRKIESPRNATDRKAKIRDPWPIQNYLEIRLILSTFSLDLYFITHAQYKLGPTMIAQNPFLLNCRSSKFVKRAFAITGT